MKGTHYEIPSFYGLIHSIADNSRMYLVEIQIPLLPKHRFTRPCMYHQLQRPQNQRQLHGSNPTPLAQRQITDGFWCRDITINIGRHPLT